MGLGHVPEEPLRAEGEGADVQGRQRRGAAAHRPVDLRPGDPRPVDLSRVARGRWGEDEAATWYRAHGFDVVDRNWRCDAGEIDLVLARDGLVVFAEVKARRTDRYGPAASAVDHRKQARLRILASRWLAEHPAGAASRRPVRFDVVAITGTTIDVVESAF